MLCGAFRKKRLISAFSLLILVTLQLNCWSAGDDSRSGDKGFLNSLVETGGSKISKAIGRPSRDYRLLACALIRGDMWISEIGQHIVDLTVTEFSTECGHLTFATGNDGPRLLRRNQWLAPQDLIEVWRTKRRGVVGLLVMASNALLLE
jgi:hypothetical protein